MTASPSIHASAVLVGQHAVLIRGPSGAGKSRLAFDLILAGRAGQLPAAVLVGDDRVHLDTVAGQLWVRPAPELAGLIEVRGSESGVASSPARLSSALWWIWRPRTPSGCHRPKRSVRALMVF